jgi:hypothetical protein
MMRARWRSTWSASTKLDAHNERAEEVAKERELLRLEQRPTKQTTNVVGFTSAKGRTSSGGVRGSVAVNAISNNEAMRLFGLDKFNKGNQIMRKMGWRKGSIGKEQVQHQRKARWVVGSRHRDGDNNETR